MGRLVCLVSVLMTITLATAGNVAGQSREVRVGTAAGIPGQKVSVGIEIVASGNENAIGFSLNFEPRVLSSPVVALGSGVTGGIVNANTSNASAGVVGVAVALPASQTIQPGVRQLVTVTFDIARSIGTSESKIHFGDVPVVREVVDLNAGKLATTFTPGSVKIITSISSPQLLIVPAAPSVDDEIVIDVIGDWNDGCTPHNPTLTRNGSLITLRTSHSGDFCTQAITPYRITRTIGNLPVGTYSLVFIHDNLPAAGGTLQLGSTSFGVRASMVSANAGSYSLESVAPLSIVALFGEGLAASSLSATTKPLPTTLGGTSLRIRDSAGVERPAPLFYVSPRQVNYLVPAGTAPGRATVILTNGEGVTSTGRVNVVSLAPGIFTADGSGRGQIAGYIERHKEDGQSSVEEIWSRDATGSVTSRPIDLSAPNQRVFLVFYGTGFRARSSLGGVNVKVGGLAAEVVFAGEVLEFIGIEQCNARLDPRLAGRGVVDVELIVDGKVANKATVSIK